MKIKILAIILLISALFLFVSCDNKDSFIQDDGPSYGSSGEESNINTDTTDNDTDSNINLDSESNVDSGSDLDSNVNDDSDSDIALDSDSNSDTDSDSDTDADTDTEPEETDPLVGTKFTTDKGLLLEIIKGRTLSVIGYEGVIGDIVIPKEHEGYKVTEIGENAFLGYGIKAADSQSMLGFVTIYIPETVVAIRKGAFNECSDIKPYYDIYSNDTPVQEWLSKLVIEDDNKHVLDVLEEKRPAIGWGKFFIP